MRGSAANDALCHYGVASVASANGGNDGVIETSTAGMAASGAGQPLQQPQYESNVSMAAWLAWPVLRLWRSCSVSRRSNGVTTLAPATSGQRRKLRAA